MLTGNRSIASRARVAVVAQTSAGPSTRLCHLSTYLDNLVFHKSESDCSSLYKVLKPLSVILLMNKPAQTTLHFLLI